MYRVCIARSGNYYAQKYGPFGWKMFGPFCRTRQGARNVIAGARFAEPSRVVEYHY
jgi:hypothetical protein